MKLSDFYYDLPEELIAQHPAEKRDESRLLVLDRKTGKIEHRVFKNIIEYLTPKDCLVINETRVIPARIYGTKKNTDSKVEFLLLKDMGNNLWEVLVKPGKKCKIGTELEFGKKSDGTALITAVVKDIMEDGNRIVELNYNGILNEILDEIGVMPLPPYIHEKLQEKERYQTVYSKVEGSAAAPTAGLHFTKELLKQIEDMGVKIARVTLHVGLGTFRPVKEENIEDHKMHSEYYEINQEACDIINATKANGGKVFCVGTTSCRTVESAADENGYLKPQKGNTEIFIYPGYKFKVLDNLITNFHLPESTLLMLISALASREMILDTYKIAVQERYRFFSFGDAMLIK
ncbi:MAG: tRNA preQ1(34) S-adenosylmethionine ribosyltransferase-isomerase QueA [Clostridia bacterium]|nr:tRNA preQ1(34) S-adenosylmethionine ribosyltransferase-isomerase QueA [Clostridia bacterium]